ncbi:MAG TPA: hypothetical protein VEF90_01665 [Xanthobacteraceae bacterium]|nr:hypothetical protein [Xanthobacteraceae bacterium]
MPSAWRLDYRFRWGLYAAVAVLFVTGAAWLITDPLKDSAGGEFWQAVSADLLMIHGGATMVTLVLLGALIPVHVFRAWRGGQNRLMGIVVATANVLLVVTAFGLYYAGSDTLRPWISDLHSAIGLVLPALLVIHIVTGRRRVNALRNGYPRKRRYDA